MERELITMISNIIVNNVDLVSLAVKQRSKFEGWLKFELAKKLSHKFSDTEVEFPIGGKNVDIYSNDSLIELKTPNTNYRCIGVEDKSKPITDNVNGIITDIQELDKLSDKESYIAFVMFPINKKKTHYQSHIKRIKEYLISEENIEEYLLPVGDIDILVFSAKVK